MASRLIFFSFAIFDPHDFHICDTSQLKAMTSHFKGLCSFVVRHGKPEKENTSLGSVWLSYLDGKLIFTFHSVGRCFIDIKKIGLHELKFVPDVMQLVCKYE